MAWLADVCGERGWPEILAYGWDEPPYPSPRLRKTYVPLRGLPIRLATAMSVIVATRCAEAPDGLGEPGAELWNGGGGSLLWILDGLDEVALLSLRRSRPLCEAFFGRMLEAGIAENPIWRSNA